MLRQASTRTNIILYLVLILLTLLFLPASAMAHKAFFVERSISGYEQAFEIPDPSVSYALYSELKKGDQVDVYKVVIREEMPFYLRILTPDKPATESFTPAFVVFGPGLPTSNDPPNYPLDIPDDMGRAILLPTGEADKFYEGFTQTSYLQRQYFSRTLQPGTYYIAVYDPTHKTGKYVLTTSGRDDFGLSDWLKFPLTWLQVRMWYDATQTYLILLGIVGAITLGLYLLRNRGREE